MAYFSTWKPHGNRVSKTWFITFIYLKEELRTSENIEKKKKKKQREKIETQAAPRQHALSDLLWLDLNLNLSLYFFFAAMKALNDPGYAQATHDLGSFRSSPIKSESQSLSLLFFGCSESFERNPGLYERLGLKFF